MDDALDFQHVTFTLTPTNPATLTLHTDDGDFAFAGDADTFFAFAADLLDQVTALPFPGGH